MADPAKGRRIKELVTALESVIRARSKRYLMANVPRDRLPEVKQIIPEPIYRTVGRKSNTPAEPGGT